MGPTWGSSGADRTLVGSMLAPWTLLSGTTPKSDSKAGYSIVYKYMIGISHKSHNASIPYPTMHHSEQKAYISVLNGALWDTEQGTTLSLPYPVQNFQIIWWQGDTLCANEISRYVNWRWVSEEHPTLQQIPVGSRTKLRLMVNSKYLVISSLKSHHSQYIPKWMDTRCVLYRFLFRSIEPKSVRVISLGLKK